MDKFDDMIALSRINKINERRTVFVLKEIVDNTRVANDLRSDARKILLILSGHKKFVKITKFGLICILSAYKIGEKLRSSLPWLSGKDPLTDSIYTESEQNFLDGWEFLDFSSDSDF